MSGCWLLSRGFVLAEAADVEAQSPWFYSSIEHMQDRLPQFTFGLGPPAASAVVQGQDRCKCVQMSTPLHCEGEDTHP